MKLLMNHFLDKRSKINPPIENTILPIHAEVNGSRIPLKPRDCPNLIKV
jgi:hypothetical protein